MSVRECGSVDVEGMAVTTVRFSRGGLRSREEGRAGLVIYLTAGDPLYSNRSNILLDIVEDDVGRHDFLLTPCSKDTFRIIYGDEDPHRGCFGNLAEALEPYGIEPDMLPTAFNCFMNVPVDGATGRLTVEPPLSKAGDKIVFKARMDLIVGLTACSALQSNNGSFKPIHWQLD